jgi:hypothetical protein
MFQKTWQELLCRVAQLLIPSVGRNVLLSSSGSMKAVGSFETSWINDPATQCINLEDPNPQHECCGKLNPRLSFWHMMSYKWHPCWNMVDDTNTWKEILVIHGSEKSGWFPFLINANSSFISHSFWAPGIIWFWIVHSMLWISCLNHFGIH